MPQEHVSCSKNMPQHADHVIKGLNDQQRMYALDQIYRYTSTVLQKWKMDKDVLACNGSEIPASKT